MDKPTAINYAERAIAGEIVFFQHDGKLAQIDLHAEMNEPYKLWFDTGGWHSDYFYLKDHTSVEEVSEKILEYFK